MKKVLAVIVAGVAAQLAHADILNDVNNAVGLSVGASNLQYTEWDSSGQFGGRSPDSESGTQFAVQASAVRDGSIGPLSNVYTALVASFAAGPVTYNGYTLDNSVSHLGAATSFSHNPTSFDIGLKMGKTFRLNQKFQLTPYLSYDYHRWNRLDSERFTHNEIGGGMLMQYAPTDKLVLGLDANVAEVIGITNQAEGLPNQTLSNKPTYGVNLSAEYAVTKRLHLTASYAYRHFSYGQSQGVTGTRGGIYSNGWYTPSSRTNTNTVMVGAKWVF